MLRTYVIIYSFIDYRELGDNVNEEELKAMIDEFDLDGDGESNKGYFFLIKLIISMVFLVNFDEFLAMLNSD
jgi:Ca2+-binding EF-hand superfamily protein